MIEIKCPKCQKTHRVSKDKVPSSGARVRCSRCKHVFVTGPDSGPVGDAKPDNTRPEEAGLAGTLTAVKQKRRTAPADGMGLQQAFQILGLHAGSSLDRINESYITACAGYLQPFDGSHDPNRIADKLYEISQAYEVALNDVKSRQPSPEDGLSEVNPMRDPAPSPTAAQISSPSEANLPGQSDEGGTIHSKINKQGLFGATYSLFFGQIGKFFAVVIKSSLLLFASTYSVEILIRLIPDFLQLLPGHSIHPWTITGIHYLVFWVLMCIMLNPIVIIVCEYVINKKVMRSGYLSLLNDHKSIQLLRGYAFISVFLLVVLALFMIPSIMLVYHYEESIDMVVMIAIGDIICLFLVLLFLGKRCLLFPYIVMNNDESILTIFLSISRLTVKNVLLIWLVVLPYIVLAIILKALQRYSDLTVLLPVFDYLLSLNLAFMACIAMLVVSLLYVRKQDNREMLIIKKPKV